MDVRQLKHFLALAEAKQFYKAADRIGLTQSALTQSISKLEKELGLRLFVRSKAGSVLTDHGHRLYGHAKVITGQFEAAKIELKARARNSGSEIRVGIVRSLGNELVIEAISRFKSAYADFNVKIVKEWSADLVTLLAEGKIDYAFLSDHFLPADTPEILREPLFKDRVQIVLSDKHELYGHPGPTLEDLSKQQWVAVSVSPDWPEYLARVFTSADVSPPHHIIRTNSMSLAMSLINGGQVIGLVSPKLFQSSNRTSGSVAYYTIPEFQQKRQFSICRRVRMVVRPYHERFISDLKTTILERIGTTDQI
ncbi:MAG TPA: LysR family transcriptional regulator [Woeseiaceae bacterium]|nr:LysR family transcriptional regulator [Woeseiaceae bacterium]